MYYFETNNFIKSDMENKFEEKKLKFEQMQGNQYYGFVNFQMCDVLHFNFFFGKGSLTKSLVGLKGKLL